MSNAERMLLSDAITAAIIAERKLIVLGWAVSALSALCCVLCACCIYLLTR